MYSRYTAKRRPVRSATSRAVRGMLVASALAGAPMSAAASYTCKVVDVPGAKQVTQVWQMNDANEVAASSEVGGYVYRAGNRLGESGGWTPLPPAPGYAPESVSPMGINNSGVIAGGATAADGSSQGFVLSGGAYTFFSYPPYTNVVARAISDSGIVTGVADSGSYTVVGFVYNPGGAPGYPAGFTEIRPTLPDGTEAFQVIPGMINDAGQLVGSAQFPGGSRYAFLYDPSFESHGYAQLITLFQIEGPWTAARGINDKGYVVGFTRVGATGQVLGYLLTDRGHELIDCASSIPGAVTTWGESINDGDVIAGQWLDSAGNYHGFIAYPDVVLPVASSSDGAFVFDVAVSPETPVFLDPEIAVGYRYAVGAGNPLFASVTLPIGIGDDKYTLLAGGRAFELAAGQAFDFTANGFPGGVGAFEVLGIETSAALDPGDATAFVTEVTFASAGRFTGTMTPMTAAGELADLRAAAAAAGAGMGIAEKVRRAEDFHAAGKPAQACKALGDFVFDVSGKSGQQIEASRAAALVAEARAAQAAIGCP